MNFYGLEIGGIMILAIGLGHVLVIKWEYYWGSKTWPGMLFIGVGFIVGSLFTGNALASAALGMFGATLLWGIHELFKQRKRVEQGLFPRKPFKKDAVSHDNG
jgi:mannose/fructose/N-acetylgalactosamine-specific phosphotransferase system component IIC